MISAADKHSFLQFYILDQQGETGDQGDIGKIGETVSWFSMLKFCCCCFFPPPSVFLGNGVNPDLLAIVVLARTGTERIHHRCTLTSDGPMDK